MDWEPFFETKGHKILLIVHDLIPREIYTLAIKRRTPQNLLTFKGFFLSSYMTHADASGTSKFFNFSASDKPGMKNFRFADSAKAWEKAPKNTAILLKLNPTFKRPPEVIPRTGILTTK
ncbi:hypothetical protein [Deinococcus alpinitundrae]|uniref:hypothetical protein n=1 Tax=Deinococcus alpinitundrae TaxID=468913 RepID=UPI001379E2BA|nr:hypothetical protein [Deinococcus alpinitundrae]